MFFRAEEVSTIAFCLLRSLGPRISMNFSIFKNVGEDCVAACALSSTLRGLGTLRKVVTLLFAWNSSGKLELPRAKDLSLLATVVYPTSVSLLLWTVALAVEEGMWWRGLPEMKPLSSIQSNSPFQPGRGMFMVKGVGVEVKAFELAPGLAAIPKVCGEH